MIELKPRFLYLDLLRGVAAIEVVGFHLLPKSIFFSWSWMNVDLFFILSGFVLFPKLLIGDGNIKTLNSTFIRQRILRLWPLLILAMIARFLIFIAEAVKEFVTKLPGQSPVSFDTLFGILASLFCLQFLFPTATLVLPPLWSLTTEFWINVISYILKIAENYKRIGSMISIGFIAFIFSKWVGFSGEDLTSYVTWLSLAGRTFIGFGLGLAIRYFSKSIELKIQKKYVICILAIGWSLLFYVWYKHPSLSLVVAYPLFGFIVFSFSKFDNPKASGILGKIAKYLGDTSYGIYVYHLLIYYFLGTYLYNNLISYIAFILILVITFLTSLISIRILEPRIRKSLTLLFRFN